jgi:hypothetical protein
MTCPSEEVGWRTPRNCVAHAQVIGRRKRFFNVAQRAAARLSSRDAPLHYWTLRQWQRAPAAFGLKTTMWKQDLNLYLRPAR